MTRLAVALLVVLVLGFVSCASQGPMTPEPLLALSVAPEPENVVTEEPAPPPEPEAENTGESQETVVAPTPTPAPTPEPTPEPEAEEKAAAGTNSDGSSYDPEYVCNGFMEATLITKYTEDDRNYINGAYYFKDKACREGYLYAIAHGTYCNTQLTFTGAQYGVRWLVGKEREAILEELNISCRHLVCEVQEIEIIPRNEDGVTVVYPGSGLGTFTYTVDALEGTDTVVVESVACKG